ncbi:MAG: DUF1836 domain-containing protein [Firmicutes bacterium]|nr:DUF1836 domain-containing protein [Bacillota bacterium]
MAEFLPGSAVECEKGPQFIDTLFELTGGIGLSQMTEITGLPASTVQNWVKRGWVPSPHGKKYGKRALCRVLIINSLRGCMQLADIILLMSYINGEVNNEADDIIEDRTLYNMLCEADKLIKSQSAGLDEYPAVADSLLANYGGSDSNRKRLHNALVIMLMSMTATDIVSRVGGLINQLKEVE